MRLKHLLVAMALTIGSGLAGLAGPAEAAAETGAETPFRPVALVNGAVITGFDLAQRAEILEGLGVPAANVDERRDQALQQLIDDQLRMQEARRSGITVTPEMVQAGIEVLARNVGKKPDALRALMSARGVSKQALEDMVRARVAWGRLIQARFADDPASGAGAAPVIPADGASAEYLVREIGLALQGSGRTAAETRELAEELSQKLAEGGDFGAAVARYSVAPSAERGGKVGWISTDRMPPELRRALEGLDAGDVSRPLEVSGGISIVKVVDKRAAPSAAQDTAIASDPQVGESAARRARDLLRELRSDALIDLR